MASYVTPGAGAAGHSRRGGQQHIYQIDFTAVASGKRVANTKRRVRWRFGFTNLEALENGETGTACRGEEHDITLVWSVTSGKRLVLADGQEVHYSNSRGNTFEFSWTMRGNHVLKIIAHASAPISATNMFRQYDFFIDGQSFFTFPKVYRLGLSGKDARSVSSNQIVAVADRSDTYRNYGLDNTTTNTPTPSGNNIAAIEAPHNEDEEEAYLAEAIKNSMLDAPTLSNSATSFTAAAQLVPTPAPPAPAEADFLLDFLSDPARATPAAPLQIMPPSNPVPAQYNFASPPVATSTSFAVAQPATALTIAPVRPSYASVPPQQAIYQASPFDAAPAPNFQPTPTPYSAQPAPPVAAADPFGPRAPASDPFTQPPVGSSQMYNPVAAAPVPPTAPAADPFAPQTQAPAPQTSNPLQFYSQPPSNSAPNANGNTLTFNTIEEPDGKISGATADQAYSQLMNGFTLDSTDNTKNLAKKNPFDIGSSIGPQPTLAGLQNVKPQTSKKEVMAPFVGALVVSNTQSGNYQGYANPGVPQAGQYPNGQGYNYPAYSQQSGAASYPPNPNNPHQYQQPPPQPNQHPNYPQQQMQQPPARNMQNF